MRQRYVAKDLRSFDNPRTYFGKESRSCNLVTMSANNATDYC